MAIQKSDAIHPRLGFVGVEIFTNFSFFINNFGYRYARKPFKGSKDADFSLISEQILSQNNGWLGWHPGPGKFGQKNAITPTLATSPPEIPKSKMNKNFLSVEGLNNEQFSSSIAWWFIELQTFQNSKKVAHAGLKG